MAMLMKVGSHAAAGALTSSSSRSAPVLRHSVNMAPAMPRARQSLAVRAQAAATAKSGAVKIIIQGRRLEVTDSIKAYVQEKISNACVNQAKEIKEVDVTLSVRGGDTGTPGPKEQKVEVTVKTVRNGVVRVVDAEGTLYAAIDIVCDKVARKLRKVKEKAITKGKWAGRAGPKGGEETEFAEYYSEIVSEAKAFEEEENLRKQFAELNKDFPVAVRRTKVVELDPMTVDEAIDSLEAVGHDFFVFCNSESGDVQIVYRRQDEGYGIIIPKPRQ